MLPRRTGIPQLVLPLSLHLLYDLSVFVKCVGEVAGTVSDAVPVCQPWEDRAAVTRGVCRSHRGFPADVKISVREPSARLASSGNSSWCIDIVLSFSTAGFARDSVEEEAGTTLSTKEQQTACSLPTSVLRCAVCYVARSHLSPAIHQVLLS